MDVLDLARWQFGITTVYHFVLVPLTIGLSTLVAIMQTMWFKTGDEKWLRLTKFYGKLLLINFALGVATGIVQEFQFGMNWSEYSRYVGDVFGAPLAMEALIAFFLESTFLGLWIFGWDRLPRAVHLATIWMLALGSTLSAFFIIAANSWMQHPVGAAFNPKTGRAEMNDIVAVLTNKTALVAYPHVLATAFLVAGTFVCGIAVFWMVRKARIDKADADVPMYRTAARFGAWVMIVSGVAHSRHRRRAGEAHVPAAAHQDGRRGGALRDRAARRFLAAVDWAPWRHGLLRRQDDPQDSGHAELSRDGRLERRSRGPQATAEGIRGEVRRDHPRGRDHSLPAQPG